MIHQWQRVADRGDGLDTPTAARYVCTHCGLIGRQLKDLSSIHHFDPTPTDLPSSECPGPPRVRTRKDSGTA